MKPRVLVLRTAGTNCDLETVYAFQLAGADVERLHVQVLLDRARRLDEFHILVVPGGFSYGDDLGAGTVLANQLGTRLRSALEGFAADRRFVVGICNGFQVLVRLGILPGVEGGLGDKTVSLAENRSGLFEDRWVRLRIDTSLCPFLERGEILEMPVAHKEGRLVVRDPDVLESLRANDQIALRYVAAGASVGDAASASDPGYPANPNGSVEAIAGLTSPCGRILGLMPHPERHLRTLQHPDWTRRKAAGGVPSDDRGAGDGYRIFERAVRASGELTADS